MIPKSDAPSLGRLVCVFGSLLVAAPAFAGDVQALVITGTTSEAAAEPLLEAAKKRAEAVKDVFTLAPGFPKVVESATVKGLKPGFWIVLAGFCKTVDPGLKAIDPGAYAKPVQVDAEACPALKDHWVASTVEAKDAEKRTLRAVLFQSTSQRDEAQWLAVLSVRDAAGATVAERVAKQDYDTSGCVYGGEAELKAKGAAVVLKTTDCARPRGCPNPGAATTSVVFELKDKEITPAVTVLKDPGMKGCSGE